MTTATDFVVLIPARRRSTRLADKALADIGGLPMVVRVADVAVKSGATQVLVATDDAEIAAVVTQHGHRAMLTRTDHPSGTDRLAEAAERMKLSDQQIVVNLQGDEPGMPPELVRAVAQLLADAPDCPMATAAHPIDRWEDFVAPSVVKVALDQRGRAQLFSRAPIPFPRDAAIDFPARMPQQWPATPAFQPLRHLGLYAYRTRFLRDYPLMPVAPTEAVESLEQLRALWHGHAIAVHVTPHAPPGGVDTAADLARMRAFFLRTAL